jgi:hypothetical protein
MKTRLEETNHMRRLMGLLTEGPGDPPELKDKDKDNFYGSLYNYLDGEEFNLETKEEKKGFLYNLLNNEDIHIHTGIDHWDIAFSHLGNHHNIEFDVEGGYPFLHNDSEHTQYSPYPHIIIGAGVKVPFSFGKKNKKHYKL